MNGPPNTHPPSGRPTKQPSRPDRELGELLTGGLSTVVNYVHMRAILIIIELKEAGVGIGTKVALLAVAAIFFGIGYFAVMFFAMALLVGKGGWSWPTTVLVFGCGHLGIGVLLFLASRRYPKQALFKDTINELEKDRVWLSKKDPSNS